MKKESVLTILVVVLALMNIGLVSYFAIAKNKGGKRHGPPMHRTKGEARTFLQKEFDFSDEQMIVVTESVEKHKRESRIMTNELNQLSEEYFLNSNESSDSLLADINLVSNKIYKNNKEHIDFLRKMTNGADSDAFQRFVRHLINGKKEGPMGQHGPRGRRGERSQREN